MCPMATSPAEKQRRRLYPPLASQDWAGRRGLHCLELGSGLNAPEGNQRELIWDSKPDCGIATMRKALTKDTARPTHRTKD